MKLAYLIAQYPAINHGYLLEEVRLLREAGVEIATASVRPPDRPAEQLSPGERAEAARAYYILGEPLWRMAAIHLRVALTHPLGYLRGLGLAVALGGANPRATLRHLAYFVEAILLGRWLERQKLAHVHVSFCSTVALLACRSFPVAMSIGVYGYGELYDPAGSRLARKIAAARFLRPISRHSRSQLMLACPPSEWEKLEYAPLGIMVENFPPRPFREAPSPFRLVSVGRLAVEKGLSFLIEAMAVLAARQRDLRLHLIGDGPERAALEEKTRALGLGESVIFEGWVSPERLTAVYGESDAFVLASLSEGIPIVLMEAMAMEIPCVAPGITGIPELIRDGEEGLLFHPADVDRLAQSIEELVRNPALRRKLGARGRQKVLRDYDLRANTRRFREILIRRLG